MGITLAEEEPFVHAVGEEFAHKVCAKCLKSTSRSVFIAKMMCLRNTSRNGEFNSFIFFNKIARAFVVEFLIFLRCSCTSSIAIRSLPVWDVTVFALFYICICAYKNALWVCLVLSFINLPANSPSLGCSTIGSIVSCSRKVSYFPRLSVFCLPTYF